MIDLQRLRVLADTLDGDDWQHPLGSAALCRDAAAELERLRDELIRPRVRCANERQGSCRGFLTDVKGGV